MKNNRKIKEQLMKSTCSIPYQKKKGIETKINTIELTESVENMKKRCEKKKLKKKDY